MPNMSYCRFENTYEDLQECLLALDDEKKLSAWEVTKGRALFITFLCWCEEHNIIDGFDKECVTNLFAELKEQPDTDE